MEEKNILYSSSVKAGKRIYYIDVKQTRGGEMFLSVTESKKLSGTEGEVPNYMKQKIFLYREDFEKFMSSLQDAMDFIADKQGVSTPRYESEEPVTQTEEDIKLDIEF